MKQNKTPNTQTTEQVMPQQLTLSVLFAKWSVLEIIELIERMTVGQPLPQYLLQQKTVSNMMLNSTRRTASDEAIWSAFRKKMESKNKESASHNVSTAKKMSVGIISPNSTTSKLK